MKLLLYLFIVFCLMGGLWSINASSTNFILTNFHYGLEGGNFTTTQFQGDETLTHEQAGTKNATTFSYSANYGWFNVTITAPVFVSAPVIVANLTFTNATAGHWFFTVATASFAGGGAAISSVTVNVSDGTCIQYSNSTDGVNFTATFKCSSPIPANPLLNMTFYVSGHGATTATEQTAYPDHMPYLYPPTITPVPVRTNASATCNPQTFSDPDNDTENAGARTWAWLNSSIVMAAQTNQTIAKQFMEAGNILQCEENATANLWPDSKASNISIASIVNQWGVYLEIIGFWGLICMALFAVAEINRYNVTAGIVGAALLIFMGSWLFAQPVLIHTKDATVYSNNVTTNTTISNITYQSKLQNKTLAFIYTEITAPLFNFSQALAIIFCLVGALAGLRYGLMLNKK